MGKRFLCNKLTVFVCIFMLVLFTLTAIAMERTVADAGNRYLVLYETNGGIQSITSSWIIKGEHYNLPIPTRSGYEFTGWYTKQGQQVTNEHIFNEEDNVTLYAHWTKTLYAVNFNDGGSYYTQYVKHDTKFSLPQCKKEGYLFIGWYYNGSYYLESIVVDKDDMLLSAAYVAITADAQKANENVAATNDKYILAKQQKAYEDAVAQMPAKDYEKAVNSNMGASKNTYIKVNVKDKAYYKKDRKINIISYHCKIASIYLNGKKILNHYTVRQEKKYILKVKLKDGKSYQYTFVLDKTKPVISGVKASQMGQCNLSWHDNSGCQYVKINGKKLKKKYLDKQHYLLKKNGMYKIVVCDQAGNIIKKQVKVHEVITAAINGVSISNHAVLNAKGKVKIRCSSGVKTMQLNHKKVKSISLNRNGSYQIDIVTKNGNHKQLQFEIRYFPEMKISGIEAGAFYNHGVTLSYQNAVCVMTKQAGVSCKQTVKSGTCFQASGKYVLELSGYMNGKKTMKKLPFIIDRKNPYCLVNDGMLYQDKCHIYYDDENGIALATVDGKRVENDTYYEVKGKHQLVVTDKAGNTTSITFTIQ